MQTTTRAIHGEPSYTRVKREPTKLLSLYNTAPEAEITLEEFELYALDRLQVLRTIESLRLRGIKGDEFKMKLEEVMATCLPMSQGTVEEVLKDQVSHFILRIAHCKTEDLRRWFLKHESELFRFRLERLDSGERAKFMEQSGLAYDMVSKEDVLRLKAQLQAVPIFSQQPGYGQGGHTVEVTRTQFFRIPFTQALDLVAHRQVFLEAGFAYVPVERLVSIIVARFRSSLSRGLLDAFGSMPYVLADGRIAPLVNNMAKQYTGKDFSETKSGDTVNVNDLDMLADRSMPLCMRVLHKNLRSEHKLKHWGRLQYGLFLKGVGIGMEDAIQFWEREFTKIMTTDVFNKQYAYSIRHYFGKEGRRKDYTPFNCSKIILGAGPGVGEYHGCPYRHYDEANLNRLLERSGVGVTEREEMLKLSKGQHYQLACAKHFEVSHKGAESVISLDGVGNHPNAFFAASMAYYKEKNGGETGGKRGGKESSQSPAGSQASGFTAGGEGGEGDDRGTPTSPMAAAMEVEAGSGHPPEGGGKGGREGCLHRKEV